MNAHRANRFSWSRGRPAAARAEDLDAFFASPLRGALGLADAVLVRPDWSIRIQETDQP
jgi:hypothetical protein